MTSNELRAAMTSLAIALPIAGTGFALGLALKPVAVTYELQHLDAAGELWIFDHGLSRDDCRAARSHYPAGLVFCAPSYSTNG